MKNEQMTRKKNCIFLSNLESLLGRSKILQEHPIKAVRVGVRTVGVTINANCCCHGIRQILLHEQLLPTSGMREILHNPTLYSIEESVSKISLQ